MEHIRYIRRAARLISTIAGSLLGLVFCAPSAFALPVGSVGSSSTLSDQPGPSAVHTVFTGGMAGWQIALIAVAAAVLTATVAVLTDRVRASHRQVRVSAA